MTHDLGFYTEKLIKSKTCLENESKIRDLCHIILNTASFSSPSSSTENAEKICFDALNELEKQKILSSENNESFSFEKCDISLLLKNTVNAADILLSTPFIKFILSPYSPVYAVCSQKIIIRVIAEMMLYFCRNYNMGEVAFSLRKSGSNIILSATVKKLKNIGVHVLNDCSFTLLEKAAKLHAGMFLRICTPDINKLCFIFGDKKSASYMQKSVPSYIDMLYDITSDVHIIIGSAHRHFTF